MSISEQNIELKRVIRQIEQIAEQLNNISFSEGYAGNISVNVSNKISFVPDFLQKTPPTKMKGQYKALQGQLFLISNSGSRMYEIAQNAEDFLSLIYCSHAGTVLQSANLSGNNSGHPSSELPAHLEIHNMLIENNRSERAVIHTHDINAVALTHDKKCCSDAALSEIILKMHTETKEAFPQGIGFIPLKNPGSTELAIESAKALKNLNYIVWEKHGVLSVGDTLAQALDHIEICSKAFAVYLKCRSAGINPVSTD